MYEIAFKKLAPILLVMLVGVCIWMHGYSKAHQDFLVYRAQIEQQSKDVQEQAEKHNADIEKQLTESARIIEQSYDENQKLNIAAANDLRNRMREYNINSSRLPESTGIESESETLSKRSFLETSGQDIVTLAEQAATINEALRSCEAEYDALRKRFNGE